MHMYVCVCMYVYTHTHTHTHTRHLCMHVMYTCRLEVDDYDMFSRTYVFMKTHTHKHTHTHYFFMKTHTHTHTHTTHKSITSPCQEMRMCMCPHIHNAYMHTYIHKIYIYI
jgi:hypothetical protein